MLDILILNHDGGKRMIPEKEREALMRLVMCAKDECPICKYKDKYTYDDCFREIIKDMNILANALDPERKGS